METRIPPKLGCTFRIETGLTEFGANLSAELGQILRMLELLFDRYILEVHDFWQWTRLVTLNFLAQPSGQNRCPERDHCGVAEQDLGRIVVHRNALLEIGLDPRR